MVYNKIEVDIKNLNWCRLPLFKDNVETFSIPTKTRKYFSMFCKDIISTSQSIQDI